jgi:hypothetical protein
MVCIALVTTSAYTVVASSEWESVTGKKEEGWGIEAHGTTQMEQRRRMTAD